MPLWLRLGSQSTPSNSASRPRRLCCSWIGQKLSLRADMRRACNHVISRVHPTDLGMCGGGFACAWACTLVSPSAWWIQHTAAWTTLVRWSTRVRASGAAHGGQVIVSKVVLESVESLLPPDRVKIIPLGAFSLKGIESQENLYSVVALALNEREFGPPKCEGPTDSEQTHMEKRMKQLVDENALLNNHLKDLEDQLRRSRELAVGLLCRVRPQAKNEMPKGEQLRLDTALSQIERFLEDATKFKSELDNVSKQSTAMAKEIETLRAAPNALSPVRTKGGTSNVDLENQLSASNAETDRLRAKVRDMAQSLKEAEVSFKKAVESTKNSEKNKENVKDFVDKIQADADKTRNELTQTQKALETQSREKARLIEQTEQLGKDVESLKQSHEKERQYLTKKVDAVMTQMDAIRAFLLKTEGIRDGTP
eukprot:Opistho-2@56393